MSYSLAFSQAIVAALYVADASEHGASRFISTRKLSEDLSIAGPTAVKIMKGLYRSGIIETREGAKGGVRLARSPAEITVYDILGAIENERPAFRPPFPSSAAAAKNSVAQSRIARVLSSAEEAMKARLRGVTLKSLLDNSAPLPA